MLAGGSAYIAAPLVTRWGPGRSLASQQRAFIVHRWTCVHIAGGAAYIAAPLATRHTHEGGTIATTPGTAVSPAAAAIVRGGRLNGVPPTPVSTPLKAAADGDATATDVNRVGSRGADAPEGVRGSRGPETGPLLGIPPLRAPTGSLGSMGAPAEGGVNGGADGGVERAQSFWQYLVAEARGPGEKLPTADMVWGQTERDRV